MSNVQGAPRNYHQKFNFGIEVDGIIQSWWTTAGPLEFELGEITQAEGGQLTDQKRPGKVKYSDITLTAGATTNREMYDWALQSANAYTNTGTVFDDLLRTLRLVQFDRDGSELDSWNLYECWVKKNSEGEWDGNAEENRMNEWVLSYRYYKR